MPRAVDNLGRGRYTPEDDIGLTGRIMLGLPIRKPARWWLRQEAPPPAATPPEALGPSKDEPARGGPPEGWRRLGRTCLIALAAAALAWVARAWGPALLAAYERWRWPDIQETHSRLDYDMAADRRRQLYARVRAKFKLVEGKLSEAEGRGLDTSALRQKMLAVIGHMDRENYELARALLDAIEIQVPLPPEKIQVQESETAPRVGELMRGKGRTRRR